MTKEKLVISDQRCTDTDNFRYEPPQAFNQIVPQGRKRLYLCSAWSASTGAKITRSTKESLREHMRKMRVLLDYIDIERR